jgi:hypothetical protein
LGYTERAQRATIELTFPPEWLMRKSQSCIRDHETVQEEDELVIATSAEVILVRHTPRGGEGRR